MKLVAVANTMDPSEVMFYIASCENVKDIELSEIYPETHFVITIDPEHVQGLKEDVKEIQHLMFIETPPQHKAKRAHFTDTFYNLTFDHDEDEYYVVVTDDILDSMGFGSMYATMKNTFGVKSDDILHKTHHKGIRILNPLTHVTKSDNCLLFHMKVPE